MTNHWVCDDHINHCFYEQVWNLNKHLHTNKISKSRFLWKKKRRDLQLWWCIFKVRKINTCANEYAHEEYIPANLSRYTTVLSVATYGRTVVQLFTPKKIIAEYNEPSMLNRSCWLFLSKQETCYQVSSLVRSSSYCIMKTSTGLFVLTDIFFPCCQNSMPYSTDEISMKTRRIKL